MEVEEREGEGALYAVEEEGRFWMWKEVRGEIPGLGLVVRVDIGGSVLRCKRVCSCPYVVVVVMAPITGDQSCALLTKRLSCVMVVAKIPNTQETVGCIANVDQAISATKRNTTNPALQDSTVHYTPLRYVDLTAKVLSH